MDDLAVVLTKLDEIKDIIQFKGKQEYSDYRIYKIISDITDIVQKMRREKND